MPTMRGEGPQLLAPLIKLVFWQVLVVLELLKVFPVLLLGYEDYVVTEAACDAYMTPSSLGKAIS